MKNHLGEKEYQTFGGWRTAVRRAYPSCQFHGGKDIGGAHIGVIDCGEWGGDVGTVFLPAQVAKTLANAINTHGAASDTQRADMRHALAVIQHGLGALGVEAAAAAGPEEDAT